MSTMSVSNLGYWSCYFFDPPSHVNGGEYLIFSNNNLTALRCRFSAIFLSGNEYGPMVNVVLSVLITIIGIAGVFSNTITILILKEFPRNTFLNKLLILLAVFDLLLCFFATFTVSLLKVIADNVNRSRKILIMYEVFFLLYSLGRTGSIYITILITGERYFAVAHPISTRAWLTECRSKRMALLFLFIIFLINLPWWIDSVVVESDAKNFTGSQLTEFPSLFLPTAFDTVVFSEIRTLHELIDFVLPLPILLILNGLMYRKIYVWSKLRTALTSSQLNETNAAKMFSVVVCNLLISHTFAVIDFIVTGTKDVVYREIVFALMLTVTLTAASNLCIYYVFGQDFRESFWRVLKSCK